MNDIFILTDPMKRGWHVSLKHSVQPFSLTKLVQNLWKHVSNLCTQGNQTTHIQRHPKEKEHKVFLKFLFLFFLEASYQQEMHPTFFC